jgi:predicted RecA/RadA family phage recombinase
MKNLVGDTGLINFIASSTLAAGTAVIVGSMFGVVVEDVETGETGVIDTAEGHEFDLPKLSSADMSTEGLQLYWDVADREFNLASTGNWAVAKAVGTAAGVSSTLVRARIFQAVAVSA